MINQRGALEVVRSNFERLEQRNFYQDSTKSSKSRNRFREAVAKRAIAVGLKNL